MWLRINFHTFDKFFVHYAVARRCIPTFVDVQDQFEEVFNFSSTDNIQNEASASGFGDLVLNLTIQDLVDGSL